MKNLFKKIIAFFAIIMLLGSLVINTAPVKTPIAYATNQDDCGEKFTEEKTSNYNGSRFNVTFTNNDTRISVSADSGYKINKVWLDVDDDGQSGYVLVANGPINNYNPSGDEINKVKVEVEKVCEDTNVCPEGNGWVKDNWGDSESNNTYNAPNGKIIVEACVKGGQLKEHFTVDGEENCWNVDFKNSNTQLKVWEDDCDGAGQGEPSISHISYKLQDVIPTPTDVCTNIGGNQASLPANHYFASAGICVEQTPVCTDSNASNYDSNVTSNEYANNNVCQYPIDVCTNLENTQTTLPQGYHFEGEGICVEDQQEEVCEDDSATNYGQTGVCEYEEEEEVCEDQAANNYGAEAACEYDEEFTCPEGQEVSETDGIKICISCPGEGECEVVVGPVTPTETPTPTVTPTPTNAPSSNNNNNTGGSVQGASSSSTPAEEKKGEVLGVTTLPNTGNFAATLATIEQALGVAMLTLGAIIYGKKKSSKKSK